MATGTLVVKFDRVHIRGRVHVLLGQEIKEENATEIFDSRSVLYWPEYVTPDGAFSSEIEIVESHVSIGTFIRTTDLSCETPCFHSPGSVFLSVSLNSGLDFSRVSPSAVYTCWRSLKDRPQIQYQAISTPDAGGRFAIRQFKRMNQCLNFYGGSSTSTIKSTLVSAHHARRRLVSSSLGI